MVVVAVAAPTPICIIIQRTSKTVMKCEAETKAGWMNASARVTT